MIKKLVSTINLINRIENQYTKKDIKKIEIGDSIRITKIIQEGHRNRVQLSEGVVICCKNSGINTTITVRKTIQNIGVERIYLIHSPQILEIEVLKKSKIRRAKLYYLRTRSGKATRLKQKFI